MRFAVLVFPGTWSDHDCHYVLKNRLRQEADLVWHRESDLSAYDAIVLPGGFSYGDYLRCGAIARFSPVMEAVKREAARGKLVIGICNGFQILCEAGLLPGVLMRNDSMQYRCQTVNLRVETTATPYTSAGTTGQVLQVPIGHAEGNYYADPQTLARLNAEERVVFRYCMPAGEVTPESKPQRRQRKHRRHRQRRTQRAGPDAPPGARLRGADGRRGRPHHLAEHAGIRVASRRHALKKEPP